MVVEGTLDHGTRRRMLITYAVMSRELSRTEDVLFGLLPFFEPILARHNGKIFDKQLFVEEVRASLRWTITADFADQLTDCFIKRSWLRRAIPDNAEIYVVALNSGLSDVDDNTLSRMNELSEAFDCFLDTLPSRPENLSSNDERKEFLLEWLVESYSQMHLVGISHHTTESDDARRASTVLTTQNQHICARFTLWLANFNQNLTEFISEIGSAVILTEVLLHFRAPPVRPKRLDVVIFVDAPLLMDYIGVSGQVLQASAASIVDKLRSMGASIACFGHSRDEIRYNLLSYLDNDEAERFGRTADAARRGEVDDAKVRGLLASLDRRIKDAGVEILTITPGQLAHASQYFPDALMNDLASELGHDNYLARERDAKSVAVVMRKRRGFKTGHLLDARAVLLSQSRHLISKANAICITHDLIDPHDVGPVIHRSRAAGALFLIVGSGEREKIARHELLGACVNIVRLRPQIVADLKGQLDRASSSLSVEELDLLLTDPRCATALMDSTVGSGRTIDRQNVEEIVENIRHSILDAETQRHAREIHRLKLDARAAADDVANAFETRITDLERNSRKIADHAESLEIQLRSSELSRKRVLMNLNDQFCRRYRWARVLLRVICVFITAALMLACLIVGRTRFELIFRLSIAACILAAEGAAIFGLDILGRVQARVKSVLMADFEARVMSLGLEDVRKYYVVDFEDDSGMRIDRTAV